MPCHNLGECSVAFNVDNVEEFSMQFTDGVVWEGGHCWATPKPSHNKPSHPHVPSWAIFLSKGFRASVRAIPSQGPATLVLKRRMGVRGSTQGPPLGGQIAPRIDIRPTGFNMTGFRCPGIA